MPHYVVSSESPIRVRALARPGHGLPWPERPTDPGWGVEGPVDPETGLPGVPDTGGPGGWPGFPERPGHGLPPRLPPALPGFPMPPTPEFPMVPVPPGPETLPPGAIWPPFPNLPERPDLSGKALVLALIPGVGAKYIVVDMDAIPRPPAGGVGGRPPQTRPPA